MRYDDLVRALKATQIAFAEGGWSGSEDMRRDYGVISLDDRIDLLADNHHSERFAQGTIDLYTYHSRGDRKAMLIEDVLEGQGIPWRFESGPTYEQETGLTHWSWIYDCLP
jgi:hypothetical protein